MGTLRNLRLFVSLIAFLTVVPFASAAVKIDSSTFGAIQARSIGPANMSGRIMALDVVRNDTKVIYVGAATGGVWKSVNGGMTFRPIFDKYTQSIGAIAIDQAHPETVWVGTGESDTRNTVSIGTGIYRTTDGGQSWQHMGLENSERISRIIVHPKNSDIVYVAVPGHLWDASEDRGLYKTTDGGKTWTKILYVNADTGCSDVVMDPQEPSILYAATWQFRRRPDFFTSGGPGSGLHRSTDGGQTWTKLSTGLPEGDLGRIAVAVAPSRPSVIYANVEAKKTGLYRSDDMGLTWKLASNADMNVQMRPFYFSHLAVDPTDYNRVYKPGFTLSMSTDGGETFRNLGDGFHPDLHAIWINSQDPSHILIGTDGGVYESPDRGNHWRHFRNLPLSQFYHISYDMEKPYNVYGGLQDNGSWTGPSWSINEIQNKDWRNVGFGDGFHVWVDPTDKDVVYSEFQGGKILRFLLSSGEFKDIAPSAAEGEPKLRFNWDTPIEMSEKNPGTMYAGAQYVFRSKDKGESWERLSPDLTTDDPAKQRQEESGGLTVDNSTAENHCTVFTISVSPLNENIIWAGTDDGNLQLTQDGKSWTNLVTNVPDLPKNTWVSSVEASRHNEGTAYVTFDGHRTGDVKPYVYKTTDFGKTWVSLVTEEIKGYARVVREDLVNPNLLFVGTEFGLYLSVDGGQQWAQFTGSLPPVPVYDLAIHRRDHDLIIGTHGRGVYIVDDITPLRYITEEVLESDFHFLKTRPAQTIFPRFSQDFPGQDEFTGSNMPEAAMITYYLKSRHMFGDLKLEIYDPEGKLLVSLPGGKRKGINRVAWYMRLKPPRIPPSPRLDYGVMFGPTVPEGTYTAKVIKGEDTFSSEFELVPDPTIAHSDADRKLQYDTAMKLYRMTEDLAFVADSATDIRDQARERAGKLKKGDGLAKQLNAFADRVDRLHKTLVATKEGFITGEEQLREKAVELYLFVAIHAGRPTQSQLSRLAILEKEIEKAESSFESILSTDLDNLNKKLQGKNLDTINVMTREEWDKKQI